MKDLTLAHVIFEESSRFYQVPMLYYRANAALERIDLHHARMSVAGSYDFTTFMNACSIHKYREYTPVDSVSLHVEYKGAPARLIPTFAEVYDASAQISPESYHQVLPAREEWQSIDCELFAPADAILVGFKLETEGACEIRNTFYHTKLKEEQISTPELALATTTFKKEPFIINNARRIKTYVLGSDEPIAKHFHMHIVDNGRTLHEEDVACAGIELHPNPNAGGSGGYARGMIEALEQTPKATHVLLMDDDVEVCPESIIRTYTLLSILSDEYKDAFISGAMMCLEAPDTRWEDLGHMTTNGQCLSLKSPAAMTRFEQIVRNEVTCELKDLEQIIDADNQYAGWWYCCIPTTTIEKIGLPLPLFVRFDDIEYSLRARPRFITMNGIAIWHMGFNTKYSAAVERYQTTRNSFVAQTTTNISTFDALFIRLKSLVVGLDLRKLNYRDASLALDGFEDFLKGPEFIMKPGQVEERFMRANREAEKLLPRDQFRKKVHDELGITLSNAYGSSYLTSFEQTYDVPRRFMQKVVDILTYNGQRHTWLAHSKDEPAVIDSAGWLYQPGIISQRKTLIVTNRFDGSGTIRHRDTQKFKELHTRLMRDIAYFKAHKDEICESYLRAREKMTSVEFWKDYLGIS